MFNCTPHVYTVLLTLCVCLQTPYVQFVHELMRAFPNRPVVLLEARHVSICLSWRAVSTCEMADACAGILERHGWKQAAFMAHSYGTFVLTRISHMHRHLVQSMVRSFTALPLRSVECEIIRGRVIDRRLRLTADNMEVVVHRHLCL